MKQPLISLLLLTMYLECAATSCRNDPVEPAPVIDICASMDDCFVNQCVEGRCLPSGRCELLIGLRTGQDCFGYPSPRDLPYIGTCDDQRCVAPDGGPGR